MIEIPESTTIGLQANEMLAGKTISEVIPATSPHKFTFYNGEVENYPDLLVGRTVTGVAGHGALLRSIWTRIRILPLVTARI